MLNQTISVAEAKTHFSELIAKSQHGNTRMVITRRNKPVAAIVNLADLERIQQQENKQGLAAIAGQWSGFDEVANEIADLQTLRNNAGVGRDVSL